MPRPRPVGDAGASAGILGDFLHGASAAADAAAAAAETIPNIVRDVHPYEYRIHTDTHVFPGLDQYASVGVHFNIPVVLASTALVTSAGVLLVSQLWERVWKERVFPDEAAAAEKHPTVLCGVDCSAYPVFSEAKVVRAAAFAERWHHGQFRRSGEPYVTHSIEAAVILAAMLPANVSGRKYVDAIVACILHDVVDDTDCELDDVEAEFGSFVAKLVSDVSTLGKLPQILRRSQRRRSESVAVEREDGEREVLGMDMAELASLRRLSWFQVNGPAVLPHRSLTGCTTCAPFTPSTSSRRDSSRSRRCRCGVTRRAGGMFGAKAEMEDLSFATLDSETFRAVINARVDEWVLNEVVDADAPDGAWRADRRCRAPRATNGRTDVPTGEIRGGGRRARPTASAAAMAAADCSRRCRARCFSPRIFCQLLSELTPVSFSAREAARPDGPTGLLERALVDEAASASSTDVTSQEDRASWCRPRAICRLSGSERKVGGRRSRRRTRHGGDGGRKTRARPQRRRRVARAQPLNEDLEPVRRAADRPDPAAGAPVPAPAVQGRGPRSRKGHPPDPRGLRAHPVRVVFEEFAGHEEGVIRIRFRDPITERSKADPEYDRFVFVAVADGYPLGIDTAGPKPDGALRTPRPSRAIFSERKTFGRALAVHPHDARGGAGAVHVGPRSTSTPPSPSPSPWRSSPRRRPRREATPAPTGAGE